MRTLVLMVACLGLMEGVLAQSLHDTFDASTLDATNWLTLQVRPDQMRFTRPGRCGSAAIAILTKHQDGGKNCPEDEDCQRAELRTSKAAWPPYDGRDVWFAFSFRVSGDVASTGSARTVIGQWKAPGDDSPYVAQRFDNGVFHITVQDNHARRVVAQTEGDPDKTLEAQRLLSQLDPNNRAVIAGISSLQALYQLQHAMPGLAGHFFSNTLRSALERRTSDNAEANALARELKLPSGQIVTAVGELSFVAEPERYVGSSDLEIIPEANRLLPDPRKGWVDMVYRIKGGRTDNEYGPRSKGELEVWANGQKIVLVRGNIGYTLRLESPIELVGPYFKFGLYRVRQPGEFEFQLDEFSQAPTRSELAKTCN
jgi:hypothetical protein